METEHRIELLEVQMEEVDDEIKTIDVTIQKLKQIVNELSPIRETTIEVKRFISDLENQKNINEEQKEQIEHDIEYVRGID
jgi:hypothetical protein